MEGPRNKSNAERCTLYFYGVVQRAGPAHVGGHQAAHHILLPALPAQGRRGGGHGVEVESVCADR